MSPLIINQVIEETDKAIVWLEKVKYRLRVWAPENDPDEILTRIKAAEFLGVSYRAVGNLTKSGILKGHYELSQVIYFRSELLQALRDNATWKQKTPGHKKPQAKSPGLAFPHNRGNKKKDKNATKDSHFSVDSPNFK